MQGQLAWQCVTLSQVTSSTSIALDDDNQIISLLPISVLRCCLGSRSVDSATALTFCVPPLYKIEVKLTIFLGCHPECAEG